MNDDIKSIITCDLDGKIETFSEGAQELFGYSADEIIGKGEGRIALQIHDGGGIKVKWRNLTLTDLN